MRRIGLIGGSSWLSTIEYYRHINLMLNARLGGDDYACLSIDSVNYGDLIRNKDAGNQQANCGVIVAAAKRLVASEATAILICANTLHMFAPEVESETGVPVIHIAKATADAVKSAGLQTIGLIGTKFTMNLDFYRSILADSGIKCITPCDEDKEMLDNSIFNELGRGEFTAELKSKYLAVIDRLKCDGAEGVVLGCTEIPLLLDGEVPSIPTFDTTRIHAAAAVEFMLAKHVIASKQTA